MSADPFGALSTWNEFPHFCQWLGVTCGRRHGRVTVLNLGSKNSLTGSIPGTLGQLSRLEELYLYANNFSGTIPPAIFNLSSIRTISLSENEVQGSLPPNMGITLPNLETLGLYRNHFTGSIQYALANASKLSRFVGMPNNFTGKMPNTQNLKNLTIFSMTNNHLGTGEANDLEFISSLTNATKLWYFAMNTNNFGGTLPKSFSNLSSNLAFLYLDNNPISGSVPAGIGNLVNLEYLAMWNTYVNGTIPIGIDWKAQQAERLDFIS
ncbi:hypothetical protein RJ639_019489 [Escallonia herrerae]|uniref:Leucine-rich repeat-containing N-terminal plant-type domain-containing protein n=1 Tax=Escallonia herrerae TaxID=1293975 RepID=A0AA88VAI3_9ASTE|nr:hypothetical protein RJ639_025158 [Escallonia herrerae]KAK3004825.1 hypothetical protein RJ639_019489 [Escallonia herrerae]